MTHTAESIPAIDPVEADALWTATERLRALEDATPVALVALDVSGRVRIWNGAARDLLGWDASELVGRPFAPLRDEGQPAYQALLARALLGETMPGVEASVTSRTGSTIPVCFSSGPLRTPDGALSGTVVALVDMTSLKHLEHQFLQSQKLEIVGQLSSGLAHDLNNLLTAVLGFSDLVLERVADQPALVSDVEEIRKAGQRATQLTRQLLAFTRKQIWLPQILDLNQVVSAFEKMLGRMISEDIGLQIVGDPDLWRVKADPAQIEQLLLNLVVNARDAMPQGGALTITVANVTLDAEPLRAEDGPVSGAFVSVTVCDTGCGMSPDVMSHMFEPFFTTKEPGRGTGLGLSTVQGLVKHSHGYITVDSVVGVGTTVTTYLPRDETGPVVALDQQAAAITSLRGNETVLLVEDEPAVRRLARRILEREGYVVLDAQDSQRAIAIGDTHAGTIDLLLTDMIMPGLNGAGLAQRFVERRPSINVLFMSGYTSHESVDRVSNRRASFLQKPFSADALARSVRACLDDRH